MSAAQHHRKGIGFILFVLGCGFVPLSSQASCSFSSSVSPNLGTVSSLSAGATGTGGVLGLCAAGQTGQAALNVGLGVGATVGTRYLTGPGGTEIPYNLYSNIADTSIWGNTLGTNTVSLLGGLGIQTLIVYAAVAPGTAIPAIGTFTDTVTATLYLGGASQGTVTFTVTLVTIGSCTSTGGLLNFGTASLLSANVDVAGSISVNCTNTAPYAIGLDNGASYSSTRQMTDGLFHYIGYQLYTDSARSKPWSSAATNATCTTAGSCFLGTGTGASQSVPVYGRVPPQSGAPPGSYGDLVIVTIIY